ncbi:ethanolamine ammonia-lyase reactivating factor EutA [Paenibacillus herberti]|uniref:Ethanolamine utilization protein n=1 Tax=Paenibacillus herberti TaxID=1619309 RepID=A0A229NUN8_9BACL|nr:ethanolamine ammonia-lyase reactivating factor EutA [Paenibacillus herberti]OXM13445.1 ethanolamine utilization protein [Paenibacillus herberti]
MDEQWIISVGIDLGTSTMKLIVSRLKLARKSSPFGLPRFEIVERLLAYESEVTSTPLLSETEIDMAEVSMWLQKEYQAAGIRLSDIKTGAVIITGETANKGNAKQLLHSLADRAGDFVVATAGADLESLLAGKGSGAMKRSLQMRGVVCNVDVGGGTANTSFFRRGHMVETVTFHVGGRLIRLRPDGEVTYLSAAIRPWLDANGFKLQAGQTVSFGYLKEVARQMSRSMLDCLAGDTNSTGALLSVNGKVPIMPPVEELMVSGGVGGMLISANPRSLPETAVYGDFGPLLAACLREEARHYPFALAVPDYTFRATVIGAGMQSTEISGATIHISPGLLPMKNIPVLKLDNLEVKKAIELGLQVYDADACPPFALFIPQLQTVTYELIRQLSESLVAHYRTMIPGCRTLIVLCENDMGKALGQALKLRSSGELSIVCVDQIKVEFGDYLDLGEPIRDTMIPVIVKTLAFHSG